MSPNEVNDDARSLRDGDRVVDSTHRDHAHRAARPVHELDVRGQHVLDAVAIDGVRVPAAHLHELEIITGGERRDALDQRPRGDRVAVLVDELHVPDDSAIACSSSVYA